ncbi:hypothetical protein QBC47DRAFT_383805 [Echria macrotheca]|uniref:Uncharacterized protein n=1 Tax=Echria macrotheca TaxID=438768 RepID=A0AAJ0F8H9_9PEZI|nr:hypothetical protein QBC47DRAFT_383805 [Echria macrotheca]
MGKFTKLFRRDKSPDRFSSKPPSYAPPTYTSTEFHYPATPTANSASNNRLSISNLKNIPDYQPGQAGTGPAQNHPPPNRVPPIPEHTGSRLPSFGFSGGNNKLPKQAGQPVNGSAKQPNGAAPAQTGAPGGTSADEVRRATKLLRYMFELRMAAWSMQGAHISDEHMRVEKERRADQVLVDIQGIVQGWQNAGGGSLEKGDWSDEEFQEVMWIASTLADPNWKFGEGTGETAPGNDEQHAWTGA